MYPLVSFISFFIRAGICYLTIETVPIFQNAYIGWVFGQVVSIYSILWLISYFIVGNVFEYRRGDAPALGAVLYFVIYIPLSLMLWLLLWILTMVNILPI